MIGLMILMFVWLFGWMYLEFRDINNKLNKILELTNKKERGKDHEY